MIIMNINCFFPRKKYIVALYHWITSLIVQKVPRNKLNEIQDFAASKQCHTSQSNPDWFKENLSHAFTWEKSLQTFIHIQPLFSSHSNTSSASKKKPPRTPTQFHQLHAMLPIKLMFPALYNCKHTVWLQFFFRFQSKIKSQ